MVVDKVREELTAEAERKRSNLKYAKKRNNPDEVAVKEEELRVALLAKETYIKVTSINLHKLP